MDFNLSKEQELVRQLTRDFTEKEIKPVVIDYDEKGEFPINIYKKMGEIGLIGIPYPREYSGAGGDYLSYVIAIEEVSKICASLGIAQSVTTSLCSGAIYNNGTEKQKKKYLPDLLKGRKVGCFGLTESNAGSDASGLQTVAIKNGDNYILNGTKTFITNAPLADIFVIVAITDKAKGPKGISTFIVEKDFKGISIGNIENKCGIRSAQVSEILLDNCIVPAENMLGREGQGLKIALASLDGGRIGVAAQGLGIAEGAFEIAKNYMKERKQFGKTLFKNQYLAFKMAELEIEIEQSKYILYKAAMDKQEGKPYGLSAAKAKVCCTNTAMKVTTEAVQMLGGYGYMKDYHVERMFRDAKITQIYEGTNEIQKLIISGTLFR